MSTYKFLYFALPALGELSRNILKYSKAQWTEINPKWPEEKPNQPFGRLPVLHETKPNGEKFTLAESQVIERYLAHKYGLYPKDASPETVALIEMYRDQFSDVLTPHVDFTIYKIPEKQATFNQRIEYLVQKHEEILKNNGSNGHYVGDIITYADIAAYTFLKLFRDAGHGDAFTEEKAPGLNRVISTVAKEFEQ
ncbi:hypothetical protein H4219_006329 [Mycoemilia scoparia]|uniref:Glutathione S-transferase n=1 Tax=Mycoemilia scoparia TaxID=417184 RepID=A0A9W8DHT6_9FUNG|nr:hypothetical protein H4219_006329 [Mycoemilia scoparia]